MVKIRLRRVGAKKQPHYRVVVADSKSPGDGKSIETIGYYNPRTEPPTMEINAERALYWLSVGAQPSAAVERMLDKMGLMSKVAAVRKGEGTVEEILAHIIPAKVKQKPWVEVGETRAEVEAPQDEPEPSDEDDWADDAELDEAEEFDDLDDNEADDVDED